MSTLYTIGHSTRSLDEFIEILKAHKIGRIVDARSIPKSRRFPWFNQDQLKKSLKEANILYTHIPELGGLRHTRKDSKNTGWRNASFRGFADYMQTKDFFKGLKKLNLLLKKNRKTAIMCAEAVPWRCHRSLIADAEIIRRIRVIHLLSKTSIKKHVLTSFAIVDKHVKPMMIYYKE